MNTVQVKHLQIALVKFGASLQPLVCIWLPEQFMCRIAAPPLLMLFTCLKCPFSLFHLLSLSFHLLKAIQGLPAALPHHSSPLPWTHNIYSMFLSTSTSFRLFSHVYLCLLAHHIVKALRAETGFYNLTLKQCLRVYRTVSDVFLAVPYVSHIVGNDVFTAKETR